MVEKNNYQNILLWIQASSTSDDDILICDGIKIEKNDDRYYELSQKAIHSSKNYKLLLKEGSLKVQKTNHGTYWIMSNFQETDEVGRKIAFSAKIKADKLQKCLEILINSVKEINLSLKENDIKLIKGYHPIKKKIFWISLLIILLVILIISRYEK